MRRVAFLLGVLIAMASAHAGEPRSPAAETQYPADQYIVGVGSGELSKGLTVCQRVAELAARADIAKQIRVRVSEHMIDRMREGGGTADQRVELVREEEVNELLREVRIVDRGVDADAKRCSARAVMPKSQVDK